MCSKTAFTLTIPRFHSPVSRKHTTCSSPSPPSKTQSAHFSHGRSVSLRRRLFLFPVKATTDQSGQVGGEEVDSKILPYCIINKNGKRSTNEMKQDFLQAMQSFYYEGKAVMSNGCYVERRWSMIQVFV